MEKRLVRLEESRAKDKAESNEKLENIKDVLRQLKDSFVKQPPPTVVEESQERTKKRKATSQKVPKESSAHKRSSRERAM